jgi:hypothetical protein
MSVIRVHLESGEGNVVLRFAKALRVSPEDAVYTALDRLMSETEDPAVRQAIVESKAARRDNLPLWADTERSVHAYEGQPDDQPEERLQF